MKILITIFAIIFLVQTDQIIATSCFWDRLKTFIFCYKSIKAYGSYIEPSQRCCVAIKTIDIPCACNYMNIKLKKYINPYKVMNVVDKCNVPIAHGTRCGGKLFILLVIIAQ